MGNLTADRTPEGWDMAAERYDREVLPFTSQYAEDALRFAGVKAGERVLDVAAGTGALTLAAARKGARVTATDFSPAMLERLRRHLQEERIQDVETEVMDGQALALPDATFDAAFSIFGLIFFPDRLKGFRELHRVLRHGGRVAVASWSTIGTVDVLGEAVRDVIPDLPPPTETPAVYSLRDAGQFQREMEAAGFRNVRIQTVSHPWRADSAEEYWAGLPAASPVFQGLVERVGRERVDEVGAALVRRLRRQHGDGPVVFPATALIGLGEK